MSIASEITRLTTLRNNIRTKLKALGIISSDTASLNDCYTALNGVAKKTSSDMTASGASVTAPAGYYASAQSKSVSSGSATTPATTITTNPTISWDSTNKVIKATYSGSKSVTPTVSAGYVSSGTAGTISTNGTSTSAVASLDSKFTAANIASGVTIFGVTGTHQGGTDTSDATAAATDILSGKTAYVKGSKITGSIATKTSSDMTASGASVTAPAGYYASAQSKSVSSGSATTPATTITANPSLSTTYDSTNKGYKMTASATKSVTPTVSAGYVSSGTAGTITVSGSAYVGQASITGGQTLPSGSSVTANAGYGKVATISAGYYPSARYVGSGVSAGSATTPATTITTNPTISWDSTNKVIKATYSGSQNVTPTVSAGYVSSGTAGKISTTGTSTMAVSSLDSKFTAANIASGVTIFGVTGTHQGGTNVSDATASAANITSGKTAYISSGKVTGTYVPYAEFTNKTVATSGWASNTTYGGFNYRASVACSGATADMFPYVEFSTADAESNMFALVAESYAGGVYIYAQAVPSATVTIPKITFYKRS